jgi:hypothetical protein
MLHFLHSSITQVSYSKLSKEGNASTPLLFNFAIECAIRKVQDNHVRLKLMGRISCWWSKSNGR